MRPIKSYRGVGVSPPFYKLLVQFASPSLCVPLVNCRIFFIFGQRHCVLIDDWTIALSQLGP